MKLTRSFLAAFLSLSLVSVSFLSFTVQSVSAQDSNIALQRGYRTGYSDGYMSGYRDTIDNAAKGYDKHGEYSRADRAFNKDYGSLDDYRDGYQQGFEIGYDTGFEKRSFDATIPVSLAKRGVVAVKTPAETVVTTPAAPPETVAQTTVAPSVPAETTVQTPAPEPAVAETSAPAKVEENPAITAPAPVADAAVSENTAKQPPVIMPRPDRQTYSIDEAGVITIPTDSELIVELLDNINTQQSRAGDKFTARVISPYELSGATIEGRVAKIQTPGRIKRRSELLLSFDRIVLPDNRWSNFNAILTEVLPTKGDNVRGVDAEGTVEGQSSVKDDSVKVAATTGTGLVIGAVAGGPVGAAVGAGVGAAFGVGAVVVDRGKNIRLNKNQQLRIKTAYDTRIR